ncbi:MAG: prolyl oligopeptidase family serine peptidase [Pseudomonadota bacterium]
MPAYVGDRATPSFDLFSNELNDTRGRRIARGNKDTIDWFVGPDGQEIARVDFNGASEKYEIFHYDGRRASRIYLETDVKTVPISLVGLTAEGDGLYFIDTANQGDGFDTLFKLNFDGTITETDIGRSDAEIDRVYLDDNRVLRGLRYFGPLPSYRFFDADLQNTFDKMMAARPGAMISILTWSDDHSKILIRLFDGSSVDRFAIWDAETETIGMLTSSRSDIAPENIGGVYAINYTARDGLNIPAIVTLPPGHDFDSKDLPAIVLPHGGPASYDSIDFDWQAQYFAAMGYVVLQPNFRGSTGFGADYQAAGNGEWGLAMQDDITDGAEGLIGMGLIDRERICIVGGSYGGYAALAGGAFTPDLYRCIVSVAGVSDLDEMLDQVRRESSRRTGRTNYWVRSISDGDRSEDRLDTVSPSKHADAFTAPVLLIHGRDDTVVPIRQSEIMSRALQRANKNVEFIKLNGENHWLSSSETRLATLQAIDRFLREHNPAN